MESMTTILSFAAVVMIVVSLIWALICAFRFSTTIGCISLFVPFVGLYILISDWKNSRKPFFLSLSGFSLIMAIAGVSNIQEAERSSPNPTITAIEDLQFGNLPDNLNLEIGSHYRAYSSYMYYERDSESGQASISEFYYPIFPMLDAKNDDTQMKTKHFVFVKDRKIASLKAIPDDGPFPSMQALNITDRVKSTVSDLSTSFEIPEHNILILEMDRQPQSLISAHVWTGVGTLFCALFFSLLMRSLNQSKKMPKIDSL